ncbi:restriction endonuclease subunit S [Arsenophonus sp. aPb]|uniref:restriction endonuclease subunit S n=1 Tax=Arsenophonus sp. aPb TaxID=3041619 RepID=UPI0024691D3D|nr:restriction endonuclease subunit S [Arsenophonus sp. aPb]WGL98665.1 restriction endonuclease subunit S [Arsenophonus sp. aPb]
MSSIKIMPLGSFLTVSKGKKYTISQSPSSTSHRYIQIDDLRNNNNLVFTDDLNGITVTANDLIIAWDGANAGTVGYGLIGKIGSTLARLRINPKYDIETRYVGYFLKSKFREIRKHCTGATIPHVSKNFLLNLSIPLPEKNIQKKISNILDKADNIRQKRKQAIKLADDFLRATFLEMFGDPVTNPKGWDTSLLLEYGSFKNGMNFSKGESGTTLKCLGVGDFKSLATINSMYNIGEIKLNNLPADDYLLKNGDIVFVRSNGNKALVGRCLTVYPNKAKVTFSGFCIRFRIEKPEIIPEYLNFLFRTPSMKQQMLSGGKGANIQNISQSTLSTLRIPVPPLEKQLAYTRLIDFHASLVKKQEDKMTEIVKFFDTLVGDLLTFNEL